MQPTNIKLLGLVVAAMYLALCALAWGQTAPRQGGEASRPAGGRSEASPHKDSLEERLDRAARTAELMKRNGGSLLRATLQAAPDPGRAKLADVSFYAVPVPEPRTAKAHDLVTIIVREQSEFSSEATTDLKKQAAVNAQIEQFLKVNLKHFDGSIAGTALDSPISIKANGQADFKGEGAVDRSDSLTARIQAEVLDVKPNGTLVLQARKRIKTDEEEQQFILTGTARAEDITPDNTVLSTQLFDLNLEKTHKGAVRDASRRGWLPRLFEALSPF